MLSGEGMASGCVTPVQESLNQPGRDVGLTQRGQPQVRDGPDTVHEPGDSASHARRGVRVVAEGDGGTHDLLVATTVPVQEDGRAEGVDHIARPAQRVRGVEWRRVL